MGIFSDSTIAARNSTGPTGIDDSMSGRGMPLVASRERRSAPSRGGLAATVFSKQYVRGLRNSGDRRDSCFALVQTGQSAVAMRYTLRQIEYFVAAGDTLSITLASEKVHISQPAISA